MYIVKNDNLIKLADINVDRYHCYLRWGCIGTVT